MTAPRGIHFRRRWYYALWVGLLLLSAGALALWERPAAVDRAELSLRLHLRQAPPGVQVRVWAGPWALWRGPDRSGPDAAQAALQAEGWTTLPAVGIAISRRRWVSQYIPRGTWDLMMLTFTAPGEPPRYCALPLSKDIRTGLLKPGRRLITSIDASWASLRVDGKAPDRIP